jgi:hypothetical protein
MCDVRIILGRTETNHVPENDVRNNSFHDVMWKYNEVRAFPIK